MIIKQNKLFFPVIVICLISVLFVVFLFKAKKDIAQKKQQLKVQISETSISSMQLVDDQIVKIIIGNTEIFAEIARSEVKRKKGLMNRTSLKNGTGLVFVFDAYDKYAFWNKDMLIALDVVWIRDNVVVDIYENMPNFKTSPNFTITPKVEVNLVIEVNAGFIKKHNINIGDNIKINK